MKSVIFKILMALSGSMGATILLLSIINIVTKLNQGVSPLVKQFYSWDYTINWFVIPYFCFLVLFLIGLFLNKKEVTL
jgi:cytochrome b561